MAKKIKISSRKLAKRVANILGREINVKRLSTENRPTTDPTTSSGQSSGLEQMNWLGQNALGSIKTGPTKTISVREPHRQIAENEDISNRLNDILSNEPKPEPKKETAIDRLMKEFYNIARKQ
jgi:hypothetical protein